MFVITLTYRVDLPTADAAMPDHMAWIKQQYADGVFAASGRSVPRTGGVILAVGLSRAELDARLATDPFVQRGIAGYEVGEFVVGTVRPGLEALLES